MLGFFFGITIESISVSHEIVLSYKLTSKLRRLLQAVAL